MVNGKYRAQDRIVEDLATLRELIGKKDAPLYFRTSSAHEFEGEHTQFGVQQESYAFSGEPQDPLYAVLKLDESSRGAHVLLWVQRSAGKQNLVGVVTSDPGVMMRTGNRNRWQSTVSVQEALLAVGIR